MLVKNLVRHLNLNVSVNVCPFLRDMFQTYIWVDLPRTKIIGKKSVTYVFSGRKNLVSWKSELTKLYIKAQPNGYICFPS